jgi:hypothetical protein
MNNHCCEDMKIHANFTCDEHLNKYECPDAIIEYIEVFDEYGIIIHNSDGVIQEIKYCPFCGIKLPNSKRQEWVEKLNALGYESPFFDEKIPDEYKTSSWYKHL